MSLSRLLASGVGIVCIACEPPGGLDHPWIATPDGVTYAELRGVGLTADLRPRVALSIEGQRTPSYLSVREPGPGGWVDAPQVPCASEGPFCSLWFEDGGEATAALAHAAEQTVSFWRYGGTSWSPPIDVQVDGYPSPAHASSFDGRLELGVNSYDHASRTSTLWRFVATTGAPELVEKVSDRKVSFIAGQSSRWRVETAAALGPGDPQGALSPGTFHLLRWDGSEWRQYGPPFESEVPVHVVPRPDGSAVLARVYGLSSYADTIRRSVRVPLFELVAGEWTQTDELSERPGAIVWGVVTDPDGRPVIAVAGGRHEPTRIWRRDGHDWTDLLQDVDPMLRTGGYSARIAASMNGFAVAWDMRIEQPFSGSNGAILGTARRW